MNILDLINKSTDVRNTKNTVERISLLIKFISIKPMGESQNDLLHILVSTIDQIIKFFGSKKNQEQHSKNQEHYEM